MTKEQLKDVKRYLAELSDEDLSKEIAVIDKRRENIQSEDGKKEYHNEILKIVKYLKDIGYLINGSESKIVKFWAEALEDVTIKIGIKEVKKTVKQWALDDSEFTYSFPKVAIIVGLCEEKVIPYRGEWVMRKRDEEYKRRKEQKEKEIEDALVEDSKIVKSLPLEERMSWVKAHYSKRGSGAFGHAAFLLENDYGIQMD